MFARMPRYAPAAPGIRSAAPMSAAGRNGSSRHALALLDSSSRIRIEFRSGLLIRGFGVRVPGGAPALTWAFFLREDRPVAFLGPGASEVLVAPLAPFGTVRRGTTWIAASAAARATSGNTEV